MTDSNKTPGPPRSRRVSAVEPIDALPPASTSDPLSGPRAELARAIPRRKRVSWWFGIALAVSFAVLVIPTITTERWLGSAAQVLRASAAPITVRVPPFAGFDTDYGHVGGGGVLIKRGEIADRDTALLVRDVERALPHGAVPIFAYLLLIGVLAGLFTHHMRRSNHGRLVRVQVVSLATILITAVAVKIVMLATALSVLVVPVAVFAMVPTLVLDRIVGLATGMLAALVVSFLVPFDYGIAILLLVQAAAAGLVVAERPKHRLRAAIIAGAVATVFTAATYPLMLYLSVGKLPLGELHDPLHSAWLASAIGPALATGLAVVFAPIYQLFVGEITTAKLVDLEDLSHPLLKQIADKSPGTWQHSLTMANMAECAANAIGANGRLVRVGAYFHDLGKSLNPKYFIENLEPGETSPHDKLPPEVSCDAIFAHVSEGIVTARRSGLHERIIDFMHMHHGNGVLEYFWAKCREQGNPKRLTVEHFRYPGVPPQSRETAILSICDAVEAAARTLKKPELSAIDNLVQRIVYGKLHLGQLDESGLSMGDLRRVAESLRETIRHANHGRIEYPWQKAQQDASAQPDHERLTQTGPRLDSLDRHPKPESIPVPSRTAAESYTDSGGATPNLRPRPNDSSELATRTTAPVVRPVVDPPRTTPPSLPGASAARTRGDISTPRDAAVAQAWTAHAVDDVSAERPLTDFDLTAPAPKLALEVPAPPPSGQDETRRAPKATIEVDEEDVVIELHVSKPQLPPVRLADLAVRIAPEDLAPTESDARMKRATNPVEERRPSVEVAKFAVEAKAALDDAQRDFASVQVDMAEEPSAAKRAAALPPIKPPTAPPPLGRRSPTVPPIPNPRLPTQPPMSNTRLPTQPPISRQPTQPPMSNTRLPTQPPISKPRPPTQPPPPDTSPPPTVLRPPGPAQVALPGVTAPPPGVVRTPGFNYLDDMITLKPQYEPRPDESAATQPHMDAASSDPDIDNDFTNPNIELSDGASMSHNAESSWARGLAARLDAQLEEDFGTETPVSAPTRAELQALINSPPDPTRKQSLDEIERLHREARARRSSEPELLGRRTSFPTAEIDEADIEAAIELAPPARRTSIGVAKKPKPE